MATVETANMQSKAILSILSRTILPTAHRSMYRQAHSMPEYIAAANTYGCESVPPII